MTINRLSITIFEWYISGVTSCGDSLQKRHDRMEGGKGLGKKINTKKDGKTLLGHGKSKRYTS